MLAGEANHEEAKSIIIVKDAIMCAQRFRGPWLGDPVE